MSPASFVHEWLSLVERSGLLVSEPVLHRFFPDGPEPVPGRAYRAVLAAWEKLQVNVTDPNRQRAWHDALTDGLLRWPREQLVRGNAVPGAASVDLPELSSTLRPPGALLDQAGRVVLAFWTVDHAQSFDRVERIEGVWRATPQAKLERWLRESRTAFGLLSRGTDLRLVHVPEGLPASWIEFPAALFSEEKQVLDGFTTLLSADRFFGAEARRLSQLAQESQKTQAELTDSLSDQVRNAVEHLLVALDTADRAAGGTVLANASPDEIYRAAVYVVMRLVFILFAEERSLLPHGNVFFDEGYGLGRLLHLLEDERRSRPETLEREADAWPRLLALFRLVFYGSPHPDLPMPAYGGDLFAPATFPVMAALEHPGLRIANRDVYAILRSLTFGEAKVGHEKIAQRYSYRNLDVEHIGYLYEGLLNHKAARAAGEPLVKLDNGTETAIPLGELEAKAPDDLVAFLAEAKVAGGKPDRVRARLKRSDEADVEWLRRYTPVVADRCRRFAGVIQVEEVVEPDRLYLTTSASRRSTGTHYTPIQYTRAMVAETLDPLIYAGDHGKLDEPRRVRSPRALLDLKVCDPAMGSGAFLVQTIRHLGEKLSDAWHAERDRHGEATALYLPFAEPARAREDRLPLPDDREEMELWARRLVAERCICGVDKNPLAAEMAKLSIWLVSLARDKPFSFVDHALKVGDSLMGLSSLEQLRTWSLDGKSEHGGLFEAFIGEKVNHAGDLRRSLEETTVITPDDVARKVALLKEADEATRGLSALGDLLFAATLRSKRPAEQTRARSELLAEATHLIDGPVGELEASAARELKGHRLLHWPLAFPEVFGRENGGFDAIVGNPPFAGGKKITGLFGDPYREYLVTHLGSGERGSADLVAYFFLRAFGLLREGGNFGLLAVNTIAEGDTRQVGLEPLLRGGAAIYSTHPNEPWPNAAAVVTSRVHIHRGGWKGPFAILGRSAPHISAFLTGREEWSPKRLKANEGIAFQGSIVLGMGFVLTEDQAKAMLDRDPRNKDVLFPYLNGEDLNSHPEQKPSRWVINFWDWPEERARTYPEPFAIVERLVKPERQRRDSDGRHVLRNPLPERWWHYCDKRPALYHAIGRGHLFERHPEGWEETASSPSRVIACSRVSKHYAPCFRPNHEVASERTVVFAKDGSDWLAFLCLFIPEAWFRARSSTFETRLTFAPSDAFETLPLPAVIPPSDQHAEEYLSLRQAIMRARRVGLTELHNSFHDPGCHETDLVKLRDLASKLTHRVAEAYGWADVDISFDFREAEYITEANRTRFTVSERARVEILDRLSELNRQRYAEEVQQGLHEKAGPAKRRKTRTTTTTVATVPAPTPPATQADLFRPEGEEDES